MKHINFITPITPQQQYEIQRWFIITSIMISVTTMAIICYFSPQLYALYKIRQKIVLLKSKNKNYPHLLEQKNSLKKENELLQRKKTRINNYLFNPHNPHFYLNTLHNICKNETPLQHIRNNKKDIELSVTCPTIEHATTIIEHMTCLGNFSHTKLISIQKEENKDHPFRCVVKTTIQS